MLWPPASIRTWASTPTPRALPRSSTPSRAKTAGTMAIPTLLSILSMATGPVGGIPVSATSQLVSTSASLLSYSSMFMSTLGRNRESLKQSGETNDAFIWTNA